MRFFASTLAAVALLSASSSADVTVYTNKSQWVTAVGSHTRIGFDEYPPDINITTQYANLGVIFTDGDDVTDYNPVYLDDYGLISDPSHFRLLFSTPMHGIGVEQPGFVVISLYSHGSLIYTSELFVGGFFLFGGLISNVPFDEVVMTDPTGPVLNIDNLYFGPAIPAPGALLILLCGFASQSTRRRT